MKSRKSTLKWSASAPMRRPDTIISSSARERGDPYGFRPAYEAQGTIKAPMALLLSNAYMRMWFEERDFYDKLNAAKQAKAAEYVRRRHVQKLMGFKKDASVLPIAGFNPIEHITEIAGKFKIECVNKTKKMKKKMDEEQNNDERIG